MSDTKYLLKRRQTWYIAVEIPPSLRDELGGRHRIVRTLKTRDLNVARVRRWQELTNIKAEIEAARKGPDAPGLAADH